MTTSGTYSFNLNKQQIIAEAFNLINVTDYSAIDSTRASNALNMMLKTWEAEGVHLWKRKLATLFPAQDQYSYQIGSVSGADNVTNTYVSTTVATAVSSSATSFVVDSATGLSSTMNIGLELDDGSRQWGSITSVVGTTINVSFSTTDTSAVGNTVLAYTDKINRPLNIMRMTRVDLKNGSQESQVAPISYDQYFNMPLKTLTGYATNFYYDRLLNNSLPYTGTLYLFPSPSPVSVVMTFSYNDSIQDMINSNDTQDLPQEWTEAIVYNLAARLAISWGKAQELQMIQPMAIELKTLLERFDNDDAPLSLRPDTDNNFPRA